MIPVPNCPRDGCGKPMRARPLADHVECRCGLLLSVVDLERMLVSGYTTDLGVMQPARTEPTLGIRIADDFADLAQLMWDRTSMTADRVATQEQLNAAVLEVLTEKGCEIGDHAAGARLIVPTYTGTVVTGYREFDGRKCFAIAPVGQEIEAARQLAAHIALPGVIHPRRRGSLIVIARAHDDVEEVAIGTVGGVPHVVLLAYYFHVPPENVA